MSSTIEDDRNAFQKQWDGFKEFAYNPREGTVMGRTGKSWAKIMIFYFFYYGFLACLFAISVTIVLNTLDDYTPKYQTRLQTPGVAIQPKVPSNVEQTSDIVYTMDPEDESYKRLVKQMTEFLYPYAAENQTDARGFTNCDEQQPPNINQEYEGDQQASVCRFDKSSLGPCTTTPYGYDTGNPCILVKLNRIIDWYPVGFTNLSSPQAAGLTESNAPDLAEFLADFNLTYKPYYMYTACYAYEEEDRSKFNKTNTVYYPRPGIPFSYYPYKGNKRQPYYVSPVVAVQLVNVPKNIDIIVSCKVYAMNIRDSKDMGEGFFRFDLRINEKK